jgi:hypothetical protein
VVYGKVFLKSSSNVANVGNFNADNGLNVNNWNAHNGNDNVHVAPLIVSSKKISFRASSAWWLLSIRQASFLFLQGVTEAGIFLFRSLV